MSLSFKKIVMIQLFRCMHSYFKYSNEAYKTHSPQTEACCIKNNNTLLVFVEITPPEQPANYTFKTEKLYQL